MHSREAELRLATETKMVLIDIQQRMSRPDISDAERGKCIARLQALADKIHPGAPIAEEIAS